MEEASSSVLAWFLCVLCPKCVVAIFSNWVLPSSASGSPWVKTVICTIQGTPGTSLTQQPREKHPTLALGFSFNSLWLLGGTLPTHEGYLPSNSRFPVGFLSILSFHTSFLLCLWHTFPPLPPFKSRTPQIYLSFYCWAVFCLCSRSWPLIKFTISKYLTEDSFFSLS